jgi:WD40 repeat protein
LLPNGKVLIAGGETASAELYDPSSETFSTTASMSTERFMATATLLPNGKVLIAGGFATNAELYDPDLETFSATGPMVEGRYQHTATLLPSGKVLIAGGNMGGSSSSAELYDYVSGIFAAIDSMGSTHSNTTSQR